MEEDEDRIKALARKVEELSEELCSADSDTSSDDILVEMNRYMQKSCLCILVCVLVGKKGVETPAGMVAVHKLKWLFQPAFIRCFWFRMSMEDRAAVLYGLILLLPSQIKEIGDCAREVFKRVLVHEINVKGSGHHFTIVNLLGRGTVEAKEVFKEYVSKWARFELKEVRVDSMVCGVSLVSELLKEEDSSVVAGAWRIMSYFVLKTEHVSILGHVVQSLKSIGEKPFAEEGDYICKRIAVIVGVDLDLPPLPVSIDEESVIACFSQYPLTKKLMICSLLLRLAVEEPNTKWAKQLNGMILAIEKAEPGEKYWGEGAKVLDRLCCYLQDGGKRPQAALGVIHYLALGIDGLSGTENHVDELVRLLIDDPPKEIEDLAGRCLLIFLELGRYNLLESDYFRIDKELRRLGAGHEDNKAVIKELKDMVSHIVDELLRQI